MFWSKSFQTVVKLIITRNVSILANRPEA